MPPRNQNAERRTVDVVASLQIPDALLAWASTAEVESRLARPWAQQIRELLAKGRELSHAEATRLLNRLEALVTAALKAGRQDLLLGFDVLTASWLGLRFGVDTALGRLEVGPDGPWTYAELIAVAEAGETSAATLAWRAKELCSEVFPTARVESIEREDQDPMCASCGDGPFSVTLGTDGGRYCRRCWGSMTAPPPPKKGKDGTPRR